MKYFDQAMERVRQAHENLEKHGDTPSPEAIAELSGALADVQIANRERRVRLIPDIIAEYEQNIGRKLQNADEWLLLIRIVARSLMTRREKWLDAFDALKSVLRGHGPHAGGDYLRIIHERWYPDYFNPQKPYKGNDLFPSTTTITKVWFFLLPTCVAITYWWNKSWPLTGIVLLTGLAFIVASMGRPTWRSAIITSIIIGSVGLGAAVAIYDRSGPGYLNRISASIGGASAEVKLPSGRAAG
jgi:hypothetical protein